MPRARRLAFGQYERAVEAAAHLIAARGALAVFPFRRIAAWSMRDVRARRLTDTERHCAVADVRWAIDAAAARLPGMICYPRALAAQQMLRRRGVATTLTYGVCTRDAALDAHAWLTAGAEGVVGHEVAPCYAAMAYYSNQRVDRSVLSQPSQ